MKTQIKNKFLLSLLLLISTFSCRTEDDLSIDPPSDANIEANSTLANLMSRVALNDGSDDNMIDSASNLNVQLPITVTVNGTVLNINNQDDYSAILDSFNVSDTDDDIVIISYPITIIFPNYSRVEVNSDSELSALVDNSDNDADIECIDFDYPITVSVFNALTEIIETIAINNDNQMYNFIEDLDEFTVVTINLPITVIFADGTEQIINTIQDLEIAISNADNTCDEDDEQDNFNDENCNFCSVEQLEIIFADCTEWIINRLELNGENLENNYVDYIFIFNDDGTITVEQDTNIFNGTWSAEGEGNDIILTINVDNLEDFNANWSLHQLDDDEDQSQIELRLGDDRLSFESSCENDTSNNDALINTLTNGDWYITYLFDNQNLTSDFTDFVFNFQLDNTASATNTNGVSEGNWLVISGDETTEALNFNFGSSNPLDELNDDWDVLEANDNIIRLKGFSNGNGSENFLNFERSPFDGTDGNENFISTLSDGLWIVSSYTEDQDDMTADYLGYELDFNASGEIVASNGGNTNNGTWVVFSSGNQVDLNFGNDEPFRNFNDNDWDILSFSDTRVTIQDVNPGANGITKILIFEKL